MQPDTAQSLRRIRHIPAWGGALFLAVCLASSASAAPKAPKAAARGKKAAAPALAPPEMDRNSSRFLLADNQEAYLERIRGRLSMSKRQSDPFGRSQDPDAEPDRVVLENNPGTTRLTKIQKVPLSQSLSNLKITTIIPGENRFLANGRSYQKGEEIAFKSRGKVFNVQVMSVSASKVTFRHTETGETAELAIKLLPPGMQPGTKLSDTPGLFRSQKDTPINLDSPGNP